MGYGACWLSAPVIAAPRLEELLGVAEPARAGGDRRRRRAGEPVRAAPSGCRSTTCCASCRPTAPAAPGPDRVRARAAHRREHRRRRRAAPDRASRRALDDESRSAARRRAIATRRAAPLFAAACELRRRRFGDAVFLYGFVYFSTYCRNDCTFCLYRRGNPESPRYRKSLDEVVDDRRRTGSVGRAPDRPDHGRGSRSTSAAASSTRSSPSCARSSAATGPAGHDLARRGLGRGARRRCATRAPSGTRATRRPTPATPTRGCAWDRSFDERAAARGSTPRALGLLVEDGMLLGVGETLAERALTVAAMRDEPVDQVRVDDLRAAARHAARRTWRPPLASASSSRSPPCASSCPTG